MTRLTRLAACALLSAGLAAAPALAQDATEMTAEEITNAFEKQKTRGLVLVPSSGGAAEESVSDQTPAATEVAATDYTPVAAGEQVNIKINFDFDSAALRTSEKAKLGTMCQVMQNIDVEVFQIIGHTDASGTAEYNKTLSQLRAEEVKRHLVQECGIEAERLQAIGMGESAPFDANDPRADINRRVEFQALG